MIKIWLDGFLTYVLHPEKLPAFLDEVYFTQALIPRRFFDIAAPILKKKGLVIERVQIIEGEVYDVWSEGTL